MYQGFISHTVDESSIQKIIYLPPAMDGSIWVGTNHRLTQ